MRITIVNGFFLPVPPVSGGSTEKTWYALGRAFAARGHQVTGISRRWLGFPDSEERDGIRHLRLTGYSHSRRLGWNLVLDFLWSWRAYRTLPPADIIVCNAVALPMWLGRCKPAAGRVVVMCGRMPKGQYRRYSHLARILAPSSLVEERILSENPAFAGQIRVTGYPIDWSGLSRPPDAPPPADAPVTLGFIGRIHAEKGIGLLADALQLLAQMPGLPPWRVVFCGPADVARGGSGPEFLQRITQQISTAVGPARFQYREPEFNDAALADIYRGLDVFCYPSLAEQGETFGVAVAEAMAAGAVPVVSQLRCFGDFVKPGYNGLSFDHRSLAAAGLLAEALAGLIRDRETRLRLAAAARATARSYDFPNYADTLLADFATLVSH